MRDEFWADAGPADPLRLMQSRAYTKLEQSLLPGFTEKSKAELKAMYDRLSPAKQKMLNAIRVQRGLDSIDVFHAVLRHEWEGLTARERVLMSRVSEITTRYQAKLKSLGKID